MKRNIRIDKNNSQTKVTKAKDPSSLKIVIKHREYEL